MKTIKISLLALCSSLSLIAQNYEYTPLVVEGSTWTYHEIYGFYGEDQPHFFSIQGDTILDGIMYKKFHDSYNSYPWTYIGGIREEQKKVYFRGTGYYAPSCCETAPDEEILLYDFSLEAGDTMRLAYASCSDPVGMDAQILLKVNFTYLTILDDGTEARAFALSSISPATGKDFTLVEGVGIVDGSFFTTCNSFESYWTIICHQDSTTNVDYTPNFYFPNCESYNPPTSTKEMEATGLLNISPNPASNIIQVEFEADFTSGVLLVFDTNGKLQLENAINSNHMTLDISMIPNGVFFLQLESKSGQRLGGETIVVSR